MEGWKLTEGFITDTHLTETEIWQCFNTIFSSKSKNQASYKFGLVRAMVDNLYNVNDDLVLTFDQIYDTFARIYWNLVIKHNLRQTDNSHTQSAIERILREIRQKYQIPPDFAYDKLPADIQYETLFKVKNEGKKYVLGALYGDTKGKFYEFSKEKEYLRFNPPVYRFFQRYQQVILRLNNYEWAKFLAKNNSITSGFIDAIENISKRTSLEYYLEILERYTVHRCFYCGKNLEKSIVHVDHFIPWSYIHSDNLWNLVLSCKQCNLSKRDRIPAQKYLNLLLARNGELIQSGQIRFETDYSPKRLQELYEYAEVNGYSGGWEVPSR